MKLKTTILIGAAFIGSVLCHANAIQVSRQEFLAKVNRERQVLLRSLKHLEDSNPRTDLQAAIKRRDFRFVGYNGIAVMVPGVRRGAANIYVQRNGVKTIAGTSDVIGSPEDSRRLHRQVARYLIPYNKALLTYLTKRK